VSQDQSNEAILTNRGWTRYIENWGMFFDGFQGCVASMYVGLDNDIEFIIEG
jgi:hypothetical protein